MTAEISFIPIKHPTVEKIGFKKYELGTDPFADLYIHFKSPDSMEGYCQHHLIELKNYGGVTTCCYWPPSFHLRITFFDQKGKVKPHQCLDDAIALVAKQFGVVLSQKEAQENKGK